MLIGGCFFLNAFGISNPDSGGMPSIFLGNGMFGSGENPCILKITSGK